jgi:hypothetical protein
MEASRPRFTGKDTSKDGKDDLAMATVLAAFPPGYSVQPGREAAQKNPEGEHTPFRGETGPVRVNPDGSLVEPDLAVLSEPGQAQAQVQPMAARYGSFGSVSISRTAPQRRYDRRYSR